MNKVNGDMYDWIDYTWNPVKGCQHDCKYCYLKSIFNFDMTPRLSQKTLDETLKGGSVFVGSSSDMFGEFIPSDWIRKSLNRCDDMFSTYILQTKNPKRYQEFLNYFDKFFVLGTTIESNRLYQISKAPNVNERYSAMRLLAGHTQAKLFITIEPVLDFDTSELLDMILCCYPDFVNIGADSKNHHLPEPSRQKLHLLIKELKAVTEVRLKKNLSRLL